MLIKHTLIATLGLCLLSSAAWSETYSEMAQRNAQVRAAEQSRGATVIYLQTPPGAGAQVPYPAYGGGAAYQPYPARQTYSAPRLAYGTPAPSGSTLSMLPSGATGLPDARQIRWSYGQVNASSDPFNAWGLSNQGMYVPWSTPMSGWANSESWNWWRNRAGDSGPPPPMW
jgi:hypothetical protein